MLKVQIHLLGKFAVMAADQVVSGLEPTKAQELLAYLLVQRHRPHTREMLIDQLWSDYTKDQAQKGMRQALWQLQSAFNSQAPGLADQLLLVDGTWVQLKPAATGWLDVAILEESYQRAQGIPGQALNPADAQCLAAAAQLYRGDLLEGCYQDWCLIERERLQCIYLALLDKLLDYGAAQGHYESALAYGERILRYDRAREQTHYKLMQLHALAGNRTSALRQYDACVAALESELAVTPAKRTAALYQAIKADQLENQLTPLTLPVATLPARHLSTPTSLPALHTHLQQVYRALADLQNCVAQDLELIKQLLHTPP